MRISTDYIFGQNKYNVGDLIALDLGKYNDSRCSKLIFSEKKIKLIKTIEELSSLEPVWNKLLEESGVDSIFLTYEWVFSWLESFGDSGDMLILSGEGEGWQGIFPLFRRERHLPIGKLRVIYFLGDPQSDRCDFIISGDKDKAIEEFLTYCRRELTGWDLIRLRQLPAGSDSARSLRKNIMARKQKSNIRVSDRSPFILLPSTWDKYFQTLSHSFRKKIRKFFRRVGGAEGFRVAELPISPETWKLLYGISSRSHKKEKGFAFFDQTGMSLFMKNLLPRMEGDGLLKITVLYLQGQAIAYDIGFRYHGKIWSYETSFDRSYAEYGPGHLILVMMIKEAINAGYREFDLLRGSEFYKYNWTDLNRDHLEIILYRAGLLSTGVRFLQKFKAAGKNTIRKKRWIRRRRRLFGLFSWLFPRFSRDARGQISVTDITRKGGLHLKVLTSLEEVGKLRDDWNSLLDQTGYGSIFMTYEWMISWLEVYGKRAEIMVLAAYRKTELIGIAPLVLRRGGFTRLPVRLVEFAGDPQGDCLDFILSERREEVIELFWDYLWEIRSRWHLVRLRELPANSLNLTLLGDLLMERKIHHHFRTCSQSSYITLNQKWDDYLKSRSKSFRYKIRRDLRRLKKGGELQIREVSPTADVWEKIFNINCASRKADWGVNMFAGAAPREFLKKISARFKDHGWLNIRLLYCNEVPIAYQIDFIYNNKSCYYNSAFLPDYGRYHPGYLIQGLNIKENIRKGRREVDLLRGAEKYKFFYTNEIRYLREIDVFNGRLISHLLRFIYLTKEFVKRIKGDRYPVSDPMMKATSKKIKYTGPERKKEHILVVDDDPVILKKIKHIIGQANYRVSAAVNGKEAIARVEDESPDLIISDIMMPEMDGYEFCRRIRSHTGTALLPFIFLTVKDKINDRIEGVKLGADAYLTKDFHPPELLATVRTALERHHLYLEQARVDELTGLPNRKGITDELTEEITRARQYQREFSLALIDLDDFKGVNDRYGHPAGDQVLRQIAALLTREVREGDRVGRWGGEELLVLLPETGESDAAALLEKVRKKVSDFQWEWDGESTSPPITISIGITGLTPSDQEINEVINRADRALYQAKNRGKNMSVVFEN